MVKYKSQFSSEGKASTSVLNATLHVTYNLIFHLCRILRKAIENN